MGEFMSNDAFFGRRVRLLMNKLGRVWNDLYDLPVEIVKFKFIDFISNIANINTLHKMFYGTEATIEYLEDPFIESLLKQQIVSLPYYQSNLILKHQIDMLFLVEYANGLWESLSVFEKIRYLYWKINKGFEFKSYRSFRGRPSKYHFDLREITFFEFKTGMMRRDEKIVQDEDFLNFFKSSPKS